MSESASTSAELESSLMTDFLGSIEAIDSYSIGNYWSESLIDDSNNVVLALSSTLNDLEDEHFSVDDLVLISQSVVISTSHIDYSILAWTSNSMAENDTDGSLLELFDELESSSTANLNILPQSESIISSDLPSWSTIAGIKSRNKMENTIQVLHQTFIDSKSINQLNLIYCVGFFAATGSGNYLSSSYSYIIDATYQRSISTLSYMRDGSNIVNFSQLQSSTNVYHPHKLTMSSTILTTDEIKASATLGYIILNPL